MCHKCYWCFSKCAVVTVGIVLVVAVMERGDGCGCFGSRGGCPCCVFL